MPSDTENSTFSALLLSGGLIVLLGKVVGLPLQLVIRASIANHLTPSVYGLLSLGLTVANITSVIAVLGLSQGIGRYLPRYSESSRQKSVIASAVQISVPMALTFSGILFVFASPIATVLGQPKSDSVLRVFAIAIPLMVLSKLIVSSIQGLQDANWQALLQNLLSPLLQLGAIGIAIILSTGVLGLATSYIAANIIIVILGSYRVVSEIGTPHLFSHHSIRRELLSFSIPLAASGVVFMFLGTIDTLLLARLSTSEAVGIYNVAYPIASTLTIGLSAFGFLSLPVMSELDSREEIEKMRESYTNLSKWIFALTLPIWLIIVAYAGELISTFFGAEYQQGAPALIVLSVGFVTHAMMGPNGDTLTSTGRSQLVMMDMLVAFVMNIVLNILLIPQYAFLGAAIATTSSYIIMNVLILYHLSSTTGVRPAFYPIAKITVIGVLAFIISDAIVRLHFNAGFVKVVAHSLLLGIVHSLLFIALIAGDEEQELVERVENKFGMRIPIIHSLL